MRCHSIRHSNFNPLAVLLMVLGFVFAWPLGLAVLAYILWGERFGWKPRVEAFVDGLRKGLREGATCCGPTAAFNATCGNSAFDDYRRRELDRLEQERRRLDEERRDFETYMASLRRARDQEEFDQFKAERAARRPDDGTTRA